MGKKRRNVVYNYVTYDEVTKTSKCSKCGQNLRGNHGANLLRHFQNRHLTEFDKISKINKENKKKLELANKADKNAQLHVNSTNVGSSIEPHNVKVEEEFEVVEAQDGDPLESFLQSSEEETSRDVPPLLKKEIKVCRTDLVQASSSKKAPDHKSSTIVKAEAASSPRHGNREDQFDVFGKNVASKLRDIAQNDNTQRLMAEKIVNDALFFAEMGQLTLAHCNKLHSE